MLKNLGQDNLIGPIHAESFTKDEDVIKAFITSNGDYDILNDKYISSIISGNRVILNGVRGSGKTMILRTVDIILKEDIKHKLLDYYKDELGEEDRNILPVYITYSGFKNDVSLQNETEMNEEECKYAREIFRGYFFMSILQYLLRRIEELGLDSNVEFNFFGLRTKFGIKKEIDKAIDTFKRIGFRELVKGKKAGIDLGLKIKAFEFSAPSLVKSRETTEVSLDDMQKTDLFKDTINSICKVYKLDSIMLLFDEVFYLNYLQKEFFNLLFGFRNFNKLFYVISAYPTYMEYGDFFNIPDDAKEISTSAVLYKPTRESYEKPFFELIKNRFKTYGRRDDYEEIIHNQALSLLILLTNGNPRILLQTIDNIWRKNGCNRINLSSITQDLIFDIVDTYYISFYKEQAKRYKTSIDKIHQFLEIIYSRLGEYNRRNEFATIFFLINDDIYNHFIDTINLLHYSRIIDKVRISSFGGADGKKGRMYILNPMVGWYFGIFTREQISKLTEHIKHSNEKDKKIQFNNLENILSFIKEENVVSCPVLKTGMCPETLCKDSFNEHWSICPFHKGICLDVFLPLPADVKIEVLNLTPGVHKRLIEKNVYTLKDITNLGISGLMQIPLIGEIRSSNIYHLALEYIDDNL